MKKYERIIKQLYRIDKCSFDAFEKSLTVSPASDEYKEFQRIQDDYEDEARSLLKQLDGCIAWYRKRAKTPGDFELVLDLESDHDRLYEHMVCDLSDETIDAMAYEFINNLLDNECANTELTENEQPESIIRDKTVKSMAELLRMVQPHLVDCEHINSHGEDFIKVTCDNGASYTICITANSEVATVADVFNKMRFK